VCAWCDSHCQQLASLCAHTDSAKSACLCGCCDSATVHFCMYLCISIKVLMLHCVHTNTYFSLYIVLAVGVVIMLICLSTLVVSQSTFNSDDT
jgi:hypothetical protein